MKPLWLLIIPVLALAGCGPSEKSLTLFEDATESSGLAAYEGMTHGVAWGDYDGDGRPDLYVTNHLKPAMLFRNLGAGRFENVTALVLGENNTGGDKHGAAWADFNNDGKLDLVQLTGAIKGVGVEPKRLYLNEGGKLVERAVQLGVDNPPGRTRMPLWLDIDLDGKLDLFQGAEARFDTLTPPFLFTQHAGRFVDMTASLPLESRSAPFCIVTALNDDRFPEVVCRLMGKGRPNQIFDTRSQPAHTLDLLPKTAFDDIAAGDFDNDGKMDLFLARKNPGGRIALAQNGEKTVTAQLELKPQDAGKPTGFRFKSKGVVGFTIAGQHEGELAPSDIRFGNRSAIPGALVFELGPDSAPGMPQAPANARQAVLIGNPESGVWQIEMVLRPEAFAGKKAARNLAVRIHSTMPVEGVESLDGAATDETAPQRLFMNRDGKLVDESEKRGVNMRPVAAANTVAGDFDNDMDLDIFVLGSGDAGKTENLFLLNDGKGNFNVVRQAGGASGSLFGVGDSVTSADVDGDGCLDLLTASGASMGRNLGLPSDNGRYQLFRNLCNNGNHWLMIDLVGTKSNRDGIGARVTVTAGGITQTRIQDGGVHERGQNHSRLHFGLGNNLRAERVFVQWPSGSTQEISNSDANKLILIKETP